jgi:hypothetical protein
MNQIPDHEGHEVETPNRGLAEGLDERLFDLLVDGELSTAERRELFERLDARPEHWRRVALAFVEAQSWRSDLGAMAAPRCAVDVAQEAVRTEPAVSAAPSPRRRMPGWTQTVLTLAASVLCAFFLGLEVQKQWTGTPEAARGIATPGAGSEQPMPSVARGPATPDSTPEARLVSGPNDLVGSLTLDGATQGSVEVPVFQGADFERWVRDQPSAISAQMRRALEQRGHRVEVERQFVPLQLEDGRQVIVPVEQVEVRPARREFQ